MSGLPKGKSVVSALFIVAAAACSFTSNLDHLDDGSCPSGTKACDMECAPVTDPAVGCSLPGCVPCFATNGIATCGTRTGECAIAACNGGFADCKNGYADGCETNVAADPTNCGTCGTVCPSSLPHAIAGCAAGRCVVGSCVPGWADCDEVSANGCETPCGATQTCARAADSGTGWTCS